MKPKADAKKPDAKKPAPKKPDAAKPDAKKPAPKKPAPKKPTADGLADELDDAVGGPPGGGPAEPQPPSPTDN